MTDLKNVNGIVHNMDIEERIRISARDFLS